MKSVNKVMLIGYLGQDPEVRLTPDGTSVANLSLATTKKYKDRTTGEQKESTHWHRAVAFGKTAELIAELLRKGSAAYLEGELQTRKWQDKEGADQYTTEVRIDEFSALDRKAA